MTPCTPHNETEPMDIVARLRRMADMTTTGNDLGDIGRAADEIERLQSSLLSLLFLAEASTSPLTNANVAAVCRVTLRKCAALEQPST